jgi:hypothetical protein
MMEAEITKQYDRAILETKKVRWTVSVNSASAFPNTWSYQFNADFLADKDSLSVRAVDIRVDEPTQWDRDRVLKRLLEKLTEGTLRTQSTIVLGHQREADGSGQQSTG